MYKEELLRPYQLDMVERLLSQDRNYIIADMGSGKTAAALKYLHELKKIGKFKPVLVLAPLTVAKSTWPGEIDKWEWGFSYKVLAGVPAAKRLELLHGDTADITLLNFENIKWLHEVTGGKLKQGILVVDEISRFKAGRKYTQRRYRKDGIPIPRGLSEFGHLTKMLHNFDIRFALTGTPLQEGVVDLWGQIYILDDGKRLGKYRSRFIDKYFVQQMRTFKLFPRPGAEDEIINIVKDLVYTVDVPNLGLEWEFKDIYVELPKKAMDVYKSVYKTYHAHIDGAELLVGNSLAAVQKLCQIVNGSVYVNESDSYELHTAKIEALKEIVKKPGNYLVYYSYRFDKDMIAKYLPEAVFFEDLDDPVSEWNSGKLKVMCAHPMSAAHGLNLQYGGSNIVWYGLPWSSELYRQANRRLIRPGQTEKVKIYRIMAKDTVDRLVLGALKRKKTKSDEFMKKVA